MCPKIPDGKNYRHLLIRQIGNLRVGKTLYKSGDWNKVHYHENARFVFVLQGKFFEKYERKERFCKPFTCIFRPPMERHSEIYDEGVICMSVDIAPSWLKNLNDHSVKLEDSNTLRNQNLRILIRKLSNEMSFEDDVSALAIDSLVTEIAVEMHRNFSNSRTDKSPPWLKIAVEYIHENFSSNLTLNEIASVAEIHPVHLSRVFRKTHHLTIAEYIRTLRVEQARDLLLDSNLTLVHIATQVGFADQSHFTKIFKHLTSKTPAQFRKDMRIS